MKKPRTGAKKSNKKAPSRPLSHLALFSAGHRARKTIRASKIYALWIQVLGRPIENLGDSPDDYNIPNVIAYADYLNHTAEFRPYGLDLQQSDVVNVDTMGKLGGAIVKNFQDNGWKVTPN